MKKGHYFPAERFPFPEQRSLPAKPKRKSAVSVFPFYDFGLFQTNSIGEASAERSLATNERDPQEEENNQEPQWKDLLPKRWKLKLLLYAVGAANAAAGIFLALFGLDNLMRYRNPNFLFPIVLSGVFDYIATVHFRWTTLCGLDETFDYRQKLKPYIVLWSILAVALCIECIYLIRKGFFPG